MLLIGLTGGIGAGKSTVARMLELRGAVVIDADDLARRAVEPGSHGYAEVLRRFGPDSVRVTGEIDRGRLADRERAAGFVIRNDGTLEDLEAKVDSLWAELRSRSAEPAP